METIKGQNQPKSAVEEQKAPPDPALTAETDEFDAEFRVKQSNAIVNESKSNLTYIQPCNSSELK